MCQVGQYMVYPRPQKYENLEKVAEVRHNVYTSVSCIMNTVITILGVYKDLDMVPLELPEDQVTLPLTGNLNNSHLQYNQHHHLHYKRSQRPHDYPLLYSVLVQQIKL